jgi:hypothetical protein
MRYQLASVATLFGTLALVAGCSDPEHELAPRHAASGSVTHDRQPLASGTIIFESTADLAKGLPPTSAPIVNGRYEIQATAGPNVVRINSTKESTDESGMTVFEETIPSRYNTESELTAEVAPGTTTTKDFALTGKVEKPKSPPMP